MNISYSAFPNPATLDYQIEIGQVFFTDPYGNRRAVYEIVSPGNYKTVHLSGDKLQNDTYVRKYGTRQGIGTYYKEGDKISRAEVEALVIQATEATEKRNEAEAKERAEAQREREEKIEAGKKLLPEFPLGMVAILVAENHKDTSDSQSDYHGHKTLETVYLTWSKNTRDLFSEMRKAADTFAPTQHLGTGKGVFKTFQVNDNGYRIEWGETQTTEQAAKQYVETKNSQPQPDNFKWEYQESKIEHREKYSMGAGYYLKDGHSDSDGWAVEKVKLHPSMLVDLQIAAAEGRLLCLKEKQKPVEVATIPTPQETPQETPQAAPQGEIQIIDYSEKAFAVIGDTKQIKDSLWKLGGKFNRFLSCGPGWIFSKSKMDEVVAELQTINKK